MSNPDNRAEILVAQADALIANIRRDLAASADFYRSIDVDPAKLHAYLNSLMGERERAELASLLAADEAAIAQEVGEAAARLRFGAPAVGGAPKRRRQMV